MAESHRRQLLASAALLEDITASSGDSDYAQLQDGIEREAPDIFQLGWVHKYLFLTHPTKLDDFHARTWQRFHLLKVLQMPPAREGLYASAGRYVAGAREAGLSLVVCERTVNATSFDIDERVIASGRRKSQCGTFPPVSEWRTAACSSSESNSTPDN